MSQELVRQRLTQRHAGYQPEVNELLVHTYRVLHKWQNEVTISESVIFQHFKHNNMTILHYILGDLLYSFLGSPILVFLEHVLEVAALHVDARGQ